MNEKLEITFLGTGTSQGVPVIACDCPVCTSKEAKDNRLRSSILIKRGNTQFVIDTGPDFRQQMLRECVHKLDAVVFTHEHKDHVAGLDDIRAFNFKQKAAIKVFASLQVEEALKNEFHYIFAEKTYPGVPKISLNRIDKAIFTVGEINVMPIDVWHYKLPVKGFRVGDFTYITDANFIDKSNKEKIAGTRVLVINALRIEKHISHFNLEEALQFIQEINPERAYLTHISHLMGLHEEVSKKLPDNVFIAYDGLRLNIG